MFSREDRYMSTPSKQASTWYCESDHPLLEYISSTRLVDVTSKHALISKCSSAAQFEVHMAHRNFLFASVHLTKWVLLWVSSVSCYDERPSQHSIGVLTAVKSFHSMHSNTDSKREYDNDWRKRSYIFCKWNLQSQQANLRNLIDK